MAIDLKRIANVRFNIGTFLYEPSREPVETAKDSGQRQAALAEYRRAQEMMMDSFFNDAIAAVGLSQYPKAKEVFAKAWDDGHSMGLNEVLNELIALASLIVTDEPAPGQLQVDAKLEFPDSLQWQRDLNEIFRLLNAAEERHRAVVSALLLAITKVSVK